MAAYFPVPDTETFRAADYLPEAVAARGDLGALAAEAEADVLAHYSRPLGPAAGTVYDGAGLAAAGWGGAGTAGALSADRTRAVYLRYYAADADDVDASDAGAAGFLAAMRRAIALVIRHKAGQWDREPGVVAETRGRRSVTYDRAAHGALPAGFARHLRPYALAPPTYVI